MLFGPAQTVSTEWRARAARSADSSNGASWTPPRPPVANTSMQARSAAPQRGGHGRAGAAPPRDDGREVPQRGLLGAGRGQPLELVAREADDDLAVEHADRRRHRPRRLDHPLEPQSGLEVAGPG